MHEMWLYPQAPTGNVFGSHPSHDEAYGPYNPNHNHLFVLVDELPGDGPLDELEEINTLLIGGRHSRVFGFKPLPLAQSRIESVRFFDETAGNWGTPSFPSFPGRGERMVDETMKVFIKGFDRKSRRWKRIPMTVTVTILYTKRH